MTLFLKKTDFNSIPEQKLKNVQEKLNNKPRKIPKYKIPANIMKLEINIINYQKFKLN